MSFIIHLVLPLDRKPMSNDGTVIYKERLPLSSSIRTAYTVNSRLVDTPYRTGAKLPTKTTQKCVQERRNSGLKLTVLLFYSRYNGYLGGTEWHIYVLLFVIFVDIQKKNISGHSTKSKRCPFQS